MSGWVYLLNITFALGMICAYLNGHRRTAHCYKVAVADRMTICVSRNPMNIQQRCVTLLLACNRNVTLKMQMHTKPVNDRTVYMKIPSTVNTLHRVKIFTYRVYRHYKLHLTTCKYTMCHVMYFELRLSRVQAECKM